MNLFFEAASFDTLYRKCCKVLTQAPDVSCSPRGMKINELLFPVLVLKNPRNRIVHSKFREANYGFAVGEFLWYLTGKNDLETMLYYNKRMKNFSDDGKTLNSAYGNRIFKSQIVDDRNDWELYSIIDQWQNALKKLTSDRDTRQAVIHINSPLDQEKSTKDVPCTLGMIFFIRENRLHLRVQMRSNDIIWGTIYDVYSFTLFQEKMLNDLRTVYPELEMGYYIHQADSLHLYEQHFDMAKKIGDEQCDAVEPQEPISNHSLSQLIEDEEVLRKGEFDSLPHISINKTYEWMLEQLNAHAKKRNEEAQKQSRKDVP